MKAIDALLERLERQAVEIDDLKRMLIERAKDGVRVVEVSCLSPGVGQALFRTADGGEFIGFYHPHGRLIVGSQWMRPVKLEHGVHSPRRYEFRGQHTKNGGPVLEEVVE